MRSLQDLNNYGETSLEVLDARPATVVFDNLYPLEPENQVQTISSIYVYPDPGIEIVEIVNYQTANVRYRITIVPGTADPLTGSTISWASIPAGMSLSTVGNVYTLSGMTSVADWEAVRKFTWTLPANYASKPLWYLKAEIIYYDSASDSELTKSWLIYDQDHYYEIQMAATTTMSATARVDRVISATMNAAFTLQEYGASMTVFCTMTASACDAVLFSTSTLSATAKKYKGTTVTLSSVATVYCKPPTKHQGAAALTSTATFSATGGVFRIITLDNPNLYGTSTDDNFGSAVAISGSYVVVGAPYEDRAGGTNSGKAYVFDSSTGSYLRELSAAPTTSSNFGYVVDLDGTTAIIGSPFEGGGKIYIYNVSTGSLSSYYDDPNTYGTTTNDFFGISVAVSGTKAIAGATGEDSSGYTETGAAYIINLSTGTTTTLVNPSATYGYGSASGDEYGISVAISSSYVAVGAPQEEGTLGGTPVNAGRVYIYNTSGTYQRTLNNPGTDIFFGQFIDISGNYIAVGTNDDVYVFNITDGSLVRTFDGSPWTQTPRVKIDGNYVVIGGYGNNTNSGKVFVYDITTGNKVFELDNPNAYGTAANDYFGISVDISGTTLVVGAYEEDDAGGTGSGKAYIIDLSEYL